MNEDEIVLDPMDLPIGVWWDDSGRAVYTSQQGFHYYLRDECLIINSGIDRLTQIWRLDHSYRRALCSVLIIEVAYLPRRSADPRHKDRVFYQGVLRFPDDVEWYHASNALFEKKENAIAWLEGRNVARMMLNG